jgi:hypothetical protein
LADGIILLIARGGDGLGVFLAGGWRVGGGHDAADAAG